MTVSIKVGAELDAAQLQQQLADLTRRINAAGQAIAQAGRVKFDPIPQATLEQAKRIEQTFRNIAKIAPDLAGRIKATGQQGAAFDGLDWSRLYGDPAQRFRAQRNLFSMVTGLGFGALPAAPSAPGAFGSPHPSLLTPRAPAMGSAAADLFEHALRSGGRVGGIAATGLHAGRAAYGRGGFGAGMVGGLGAAAGFAAFQGIGALVGAVRQQIGAAEQESIGFADLYRRLGGTGAGNSFGGLRARVRAASDAIGIGYDEALGLAGIAARRGNLSGARDVAQVVELGGGFARGFGFEPGAGVAAFASLRGAGVARSTEEGRRLGLSIAEGIARAGVFAKAEDYLAEVAAYGEQTARATLTRPNVEGFNAALAGMIGQRRSGLDVTGAAAIINRADQAIRRGGAAGEAGQAFLYQSIGRRLGLDPLMVEVMQEGGLFATARNTFGRDTVAGDFFRGAGLDPNNTDETPILQMVMEGLRQQYTGPNRRLLANATSNLLGVNQRQAMALLDLKPEQLGGLRELVSEDQLRNLTGTGIAQLGRIGAARGREGLTAIAAELMARTGRDALDPAERDRLIAAQRGTDDELRRILAELTASRQAEETEGDRTRRTLQEIDKTLRDVATILVEPLNTARDTLLRIAGTGGRSATRRQMAESARDAEMREANEMRDQELAVLARSQAGARAAAARRMSDAADLTNGMTPEARAAALAEAHTEIAALDAQRQEIVDRHARARGEAERRFRETTAPRAPGGGGAALGGQERAAVESYLDETDRILGLRPGTSRAQIAQESSWNPNAVSRRGAQGLAQVMPETLAALSRRLGRPLDPFDPMDAALIHREVMRENMARFGNQDDALRAYNGGWDRSRWNNPETQGYVPAIERNRAATPLPSQGGADQATPLPAAPQQQGHYGAGGAQHAAATVTGHFILTDPGGRPLAAPITVRTNFGAPRAYGAMA